MSPGRLDHALATGRPSEEAASLALRARRLTSLSRRRSLAETINRIVREAHEGPRGSYLRIAPASRRVVAAREELSRLAHLLAEPGPVATSGVAQASLLLTDGTGPLYNPRSPGDLRASAERAIESLNWR